MTTALSQNCPSASKSKETDKKGLGRILPGPFFYGLHSDTLWLLSSIGSIYRLRMARSQHISRQKEWQDTITPLTMRQPHMERMRPKTWQ